MNIIDLRQRYPSLYKKRPGGLRDIVRAIIHHSAGSIPTTPAQALAQLDSIYNHHTKTLGWPGSGYHYAVACGNVYQLNDLDEISYHTAYNNDDSIGIVILGTFEWSTPAPRDLDAARQLVGHLEAVTGRELGIQGHAEANPSSTAYCPSRNWHAWKNRVEPERLTEDERYFSTFGVPAIPGSAIWNYWTKQRQIGANMGPAITPEMDGKAFGEDGNIVQFFANAVVVCKPSENWACYRALQYLEPERWKLPA